MRPRTRTPYHDSRWKTLRIRILRRDGGICQIRGPRCLGSANTADHIIAWRNGGSWFDPANLRAACQPCNNGRLTTVAVDRAVSVSPSRDW